MKARKIAEAQKHLENAAKCMKTSFFKRKPDLHGATIEYFEAGQAFYVAEDLEQAIEYYEKSAELDVELENDLDAGQKFEKCALLSLQRRDQNSEADARKFYDLCCEKYLLANSMDKAAECLVKVAKVVEKTNINMSAGYMLRACNLLVNFDRQDFAVDTFNNTLNLLLRIGRFMSAIILLRRMITLFTKLQQPHNVFKCYLSIVIIYLGAGDVPAAKQEFEQHLQVDTYLRSNEIALEEDIVKAMEEFDEDAVEALKQHNQLNFVQQQVNRIGKNLVVAGCVPWFCNESDQLLKQAEGDESVPVDLAPSKPAAQATVVKKVAKPKEKKEAPKEKKETPKEVRKETPKEAPKEAPKETPKESPAEKVEEKPMSALEALEKAAMDGGDDDEFNLCSLVCSINIVLVYNYNIFSSFPRFAYDHLSFLLNYASLYKNYPYPRGSPMDTRRIHNRSSFLLTITILFIPYRLRLQLQ